MSFTLHSEGNWSDEAIAGGKPKELSVSSPDSLQGLLKSVKKNNDTDIPVVYEATHHGPLLETPSLFFEFGGGATENQKPYEIMAKALSDWLEEPPDSCEKIAFGIGGGHYPEKFTKLSLESKYSFSHIMPKYHADVDMVKKGLSRASAPAECALIDWKGIKSAERDAIVKRLEELGIDHVRL
jgi:D-aminoacyl-tRNA deacylase